MIGFNPYDIYALLYGTLTFGDSSNCTDPGNWIGNCVWFLIFVRFFIVRWYFLTYSIVIRFLFEFSFRFFLSICNCLCLLIYSHSATKGVFNTMPYPNISWPDVVCTMVWYMLHTAKAVSSKIPDQGSSSSK